MSKAAMPTEIKLHQKSRLLELTYESGENFKLPCEYLRTQGKSAEVVTNEMPVANKADVNIEKIEMQGNYALRIYFDDGYDSSGFSWGSLYDLAVNYEENWADYLAALEKYGLTRTINENEASKIQIKVLYFMRLLIKVTRKEEEDIELKPEQATVGELLALLRKRGKEWPEPFADNAVQITVNKHFAELFTRLENNDEVAIVPVPKGGQEETS